MSDVYHEIKKTKQVADQSDSSEESDKRFSLSADITMQLIVIYEQHHIIRITHWPYLNKVHINDIINTYNVPVLDRIMAIRRSFDVMCKTM